MLRSSLFFILNVGRNLKGVYLVAEETVQLITPWTAGTCLNHLLGSSKDNSAITGISVPLHFSTRPFPRG